MERAELIKAIEWLDQAMDQVKLLPLIPPLACLRSIALDRLAVSSGGGNRELTAACRALPSLCGGDPWPLALPGTLRRVLTALCAPAINTKTSVAAARIGCCQCLQGLRTFQIGETALTTLLRFYSPEIAAEETQMYREQCEILQTACARQLLLYRCAVKAEARHLRARYTAEAEEALRSLPTAEEIGRWGEYLRITEEMTKEKMLAFFHAADKTVKSPLNTMNTAEGGEWIVLHSGLEPQMAGPQPQPPHPGQFEIPAEPA